LVPFKIRRSKYINSKDSLFELMQRMRIRGVNGSDIIRIYPDPDPEKSGYGYSDTDIFGYGSGFG